LLRLARHPDLVLCWGRKGPLIRNLESGITIEGGPGFAAILGLFDRPRSAESAARRLPHDEPRRIRRGIEDLRRIGFLLPVDEARKKSSRIRAWKENVASAFYHAASRDLRYLQEPGAVEGFVRSRVLSTRRPPLSKRYRSLVRWKLPAPSTRERDLRPDLEATLAERRTVREFRRAPVAFEDLGRIVRGTWGKTGTLDGGLLGRLMTKTSPSGGALHPIECYVIAWNVRGLPPGLYHYDVASDELRRLKRGNLRAAAVRAASGQTWVGRAAFLCVMTAVFARSLWKYQSENAYRILWLDAGHLCQTFDLLATARGLGPFQTAAIQDSYIEKLIGLDGVKEFPVYLCGAGVPVRAPCPSGRGQV
jgi:SagB-type dehydrogenase family enzyme